MGPGRTRPGVWPTDCHFTTRGDDPLADDLVAFNGRVSGRDLLLDRSTERKPIFEPTVFTREKSSPHRTAVGLEPTCGGGSI